MAQLVHHLRKTKHVLNVMLEQRRVLSGPNDHFTSLVEHDMPGLRDTEMQQNGQTPKVLPSAVVTNNHGGAEANMHDKITHDARKNATYQSSDEQYRGLEIIKTVRMEHSYV